MKKVSLLVTILFFAASGVMQAQQGPRGGDRNVDPKTRAEQMTERMVKEYSLSDTQKKKVYDANLAFWEKMSANRPEAPKKDGDQAQKDKKSKEKAEKKEKKEKPEKKDRQKADTDKARAPRDMPAGMKEAREAYDAQLKTILTSEQYAAYTKNREERQQRQGNRGGGGRPQ